MNKRLECIFWRRKSKAKYLKMKILIDTEFEEIKFNEYSMILILELSICNAD
jgi:hypothetical protein